MLADIINIDINSIMAGRRDNDQSTFRITLEVDNDSALPKLLEGRVSVTLVLLVFWLIKKNAVFQLIK